MPRTDEISRGMTLQLESWREMLLDGDKHLGWKMGFNDPAARERFQLPSPIAGYLTYSTLLEKNSTYQPDEGASILLEAELAIQIKQDIDTPVDDDQGLGLISAIAPAVELVDMSAGVEDFSQVLADNIFHRAVMIGDPITEFQHLTPHDLATELFVDGQHVADGEPEKRLPGKFGELVSFLSAYLLQHGARLHANDWVICGSIIAPARITRGQQASIKLAHIGDLSVTIG